MFDNINTSKPNRSRLMCLRATKYFDDKMEHKAKIRHILDHPRESHWHIPDDIKEEDFLDFVDEVDNVTFKKLEYEYRGERK